MIPKAKYDKGNVAQSTLILKPMLASVNKYSIIDTICYCFSSFSLRWLRFNFTLSVKSVGFNYESLASIYCFPGTQIYLNGRP